jgi:hypothetical protein
MKKQWIALFFILCFGLSLIFSQEDESKNQSNTEPIPSPLPIAKQETLSPVVTYKIDAHLLPDGRKILGSQKLIWFNKSSMPVYTLRFHLYYNGFRSPDTLLLNNLKFYKKTKKELKSIRFGGIKITEMRVIEGEELTDKTRFIPPEKDNVDDRTVMEVKLTSPVLPNQSITIKMDFIVTIPEIILRTGFQEDYFFLSHWFPKIGFLNSNGKWHCPHFQINSDFFSNYGQYEVRITCPGKFIVGAPGNLIHKEKNPDDTFTYFFKEKDIHDFAWVAYPHFKRVIDKVNLKGNPTPTTIELLIPQGHADSVPRYLNAIKYSLKFFADHIITYPYKKFTLVDPPYKAVKSGFTEYPTLVTGFFCSILPDSLKITEISTFHQVSHQFWFGMVEANRSLDAWLDEGIASFFQMEILEEYFKDSGSFLDSRFLKINQSSISRIAMQSLSLSEQINQHPEEFLNETHFKNSVNHKAALFFRSLKNLVGKEKMYEFFKYYTRKYKYHHPNTQDFIKTFNQFMNEDFSWAFEQLINGDIEIDNLVYSIRSEKSGKAPFKYRNEVVFLRKKGYFPAELLIKLEKGKEIKYFWRERKKWKRIIFYDSHPIAFACIDPAQKIELDKNIINNSMTSKINYTGFLKLSLKLEFLFQNILSFLLF